MNPALYIGLYINLFSNSNWAVRHYLFSIWCKFTKHLVYSHQEILIPLNVSSIWRFVSLTAAHAYVVRVLVLWHAVSFNNPSYRETIMKKQALSICGMNICLSTSHKEENKTTDKPREQSQLHHTHWTTDRHAVTKETYYFHWQWSLVLGS